MPMVAERTIRSRWRLNLAQQFLLGSLVILLLSMAGVGGWVARQIEEGVVQRSAATTALYVDSLVAPALQDLADGNVLSSEAEDQLTWLFEDTPLGREVLLFQVWDRDRQIVFSTVPDMVGQAVATDPELDRAMAGTVQAQIGQAEGSELLSAESGHRDLLEIYSPLRSRGTNEIIGVAEFYYALDDLREEIANAQRQSWLVLGAVTFLVYVLLAAFVRRASETIERQQLALSSQVNELSALLRQNEELHQRARGAAARAVALNERFLRRISADLHDGPAQDISLALLRLDGVAEELDIDGSGPSEIEDGGEIGLIQASLRRALQELRTTSSGILLPQLSALSVAGVIDLVCRAHRRRTGAVADVTMRDVPEQAPLATKIAIYRILQEALNNSARHAAGAQVTVQATGTDGYLRIEIADDGPGFDPSAFAGGEERLGMAGMRERTESLGGTLAIETDPGAGTRIVAELPMSGGGDDD